MQIRTAPAKAQKRSRQSASARPRATRTGGRSARVRASVLSAAFAVLTEKGAADFTIGEVATRAGVHETSIYRRWKTKSALAVDACLNFAAEALQIPDKGSLRADLVDLLVRVSKLLRSPQGKALLALVSANDRDSIEARRAYWQSRLDTAAVIFERAKGRREIEMATDSRTLLETLVAPFYFRALVTLEPIEDWPIEDMIDHQISGVLASRRTGSIKPRPTVRRRKQPEVR